MSENKNPLLSDRQVRPTDELIFSVIGDKKSLWKKVMDHLRDQYPDSSGEWNYYNDGKSWLFKMIQKKKTIFWIGILENTFRITFYFGDKAEPVINASDLPESIKNEFRLSKRYGAIRAVTIKMEDSTDAENVLKLVAVKNKLK